MKNQDRELCLIYARSRNHCIGIDGGLPWSLPAEYQHFERTVFGYPIIMGRRSYEDHDGLLANSKNIVVSAQTRLSIEPEAYLAKSLEDAMNQAFKLSNRIFVIGGAGLINEAMPLSHVVYESIVDTDIQGDTFLNSYTFSDWSTESILKHDINEQHKYRFECLKHSR